MRKCAIIIKDFTKSNIKYLLVPPYVPLRQRGHDTFQLPSLLHRSCLEPSKLYPSEHRKVTTSPSLVPVKNRRPLGTNTKSSQLARPVNNDDVTHTKPFITSLCTIKCKSTSASSSLLLVFQLNCLISKLIYW